MAQKFVYNNIKSIKAKDLYTLSVVSGTANAYQKAKVFLKSALNGLMNTKVCSVIYHVIITLKVFYNRLYTGVRDGQACRLVLAN